MVYLLSRLKHGAVSAVLAASLSLAESAEGYISNIGTQANLKGLKRITQKLVAPPFLPKHEQVATGGPKIVEMEMFVEEKEIEVKPGVFVQAMTFDGTNPGPIVNLPILVTP